MDGLPLISVVVPAYNRATTIGAALQSIQAQTYQSWEAIVVDDGSVDSTPEVVAQLAREDARLRLIRHERNLGAQAARNKGIHAARGEWIAFLDSDDQFLPTSLEVRMELARKEKVSVVHSDCRIIHIDGSIDSYARVRPLSGQIYRRVLTGDSPLFPALLVCKASLRRINYLDERIVAFQEWDTAIRLAKHYVFGYEPTSTFINDRRNIHRISRDLLRNARGYEQVFHKHYRAILRYTGPRELAEHYRVAASWYQAAGDQRAVRRCHLTALVWSSLDLKTTLQKLKRLLYEFI